MTLFPDTLGDVLSESILAFVFAVEIASCLPALNFAVQFPDVM